MTPTPVPEDFHTITPQMVVKGVAAAIDWYTKALGAHELLRNAAPDGTSIMHAELLLGDSRFFVVDEFPDSVVSPSTTRAVTSSTPCTARMAARSSVPRSVGIRTAAARSLGVCRTKAGGPSRARSTT